MQKVHGVLPLTSWQKYFEHIDIHQVKGVYLLREVLPDHYGQPS